MSPTTRAVYHWRRKLKAHESEPASRMAPSSSATGPVVAPLVVVSRSMPLETVTGSTVSISALSRIITATKIIVARAGRK